MVPSDELVMKKYSYSKFIRRYSLGMLMIMGFVPLCTCTYIRNTYYILHHRKTERRLSTGYSKLLHYLNIISVSFTRHIPDRKIFDCRYCIGSQYVGQFWICQYRMNMFGKLMSISHFSRQSCF